jgi:hypothetical protein
MGEHLHVRVLDLTTGSTLVEHKIDEANTAIMGDRDGEIALHALDRGHTVALEVMDCDGDISTAGEWQRVVTMP